MNAQTTDNSAAATLDTLAHVLLGRLAELAGAAVIAVAFMTAFPMG